MTTITKERLLKIQQWSETYGAGSNVMLPAEEAEELARIALASLEAEPVSQPYKLPEEKGASLQLRNLIRKRHAEWSDSTFGNVGPVGPLKHLSKEALEAAAEPGDLSEWADMQFLLWDAQRRAGISDGEITAAMEEKLKVNMARQWPEPKDGEPRLHIKEQPVPVVPAEMPKGLAGQIVSLLAHNIGDKLLAQKIWNACRAAMLQSKYRDLSQPVDPQISEYEKIMQRAGWVMVPVEPTDEMIEAAMNCEDVLFNSDESFCVQFGNIYEAMLAAAPQH
ncbi:DUF550 domain-containing protein [Salmonella enterica]|uniref:DUF550 domain-containing protein n=4 Tax=Salmonella enterica TaxID=28901 RepID=A0A618FA29_SALMU|nr:DUF550 domain-containing protein [Salmonella enterica]ECH6071113.1 DUF550 domain-containing protein [Salmonella enterica subsp. enterica serovar Reading]ECI0672077.1 DUF550 domain-containing protein [Salmonella enterica subsp. enterica serovar Rubislaw]EDW8352062.1 DUF550 domain-containing protein [Salmonella enterica subsp. enterica serovar 6,8:-:1,2]EGY1031994.1 DUF550 domain-containing protein [Salmonella enterica subsp. enterica serovar Hartford]EAA8159287.1 DUF550 domain-containing pro